MNNKELLIGAGALGLLVGVPYLLKLKRLSDELETVTRVNIHKVELSGLVLRVDVLLKNPSGGSITVKHPFIKMMYADKTFATSEIRNQDFVLPQFSQKEIDPIFVSIGFLSLASTAPDVLSEYRKNGTARIDVKTTTTLNGRIPYTKTDNIQIGSTA